MALATGRLMMPCLTLPLAMVMTRRLGRGRVGMVRSSHTREGLVGPLPVFVALRGMVEMLRIVRNAELVLVAPRPTERGAFLLCRGFVMLGRPTVGKAALFFFEPKSS